MASIQHTDTSRKDIQDSTNEILLFRGNELVLKAERGVTLGLIKLIYSSDDSNSGILLGVKPRLIDKVPCLVTFDSTTLNHDAYDLIIQDVRSDTTDDTEHNAAQNTSSNNNNLRQTIENALASSLLIPKSSDMNTNRQSSLTYQNSSLVINDSSDDFGDLQEFCAINDNNSSPDVDSPEDLDFSLNVDSSSEGFEEENQQDKSGEDSAEVFERQQFIPEEFNFDIKTVIPTQTDAGLRWPCDRCGKDYCSASHLKRHWILHTNFKPFKCKVCDKTFPFHWDLKRHITKHTGNKRFKCADCTKSFNTQKELKCHKWLHTGRKEYKCQVCHHEISSPGNLKVHMRKHTGEKPYKCEYCPKAFYMLGHYQYHVRRHTGEKPYKCDICNKAFSYSCNLSEHKNIHTGERPHSCPKCDKKFAHRSTLKQHILVHGGQRPYKCHLCSKNFVQSSNYRMHLLTHKDKQDRVQKCDICGKELLSRRGVKLHRQRCVQRFVDRANVVTEKNTHEKVTKKSKFECKVCARMFTYRANYDAHCKIHETTNEQKGQNNEQNSRAQDSSSSRGKVTCPICRKQFLYIKCIKKHLQRRHAGVELPSNAQSTNNLENSSSTNSCSAEVRVNADTNAKATDTQTGVQNSFPIIFQSTLPTIHIQPTGTHAPSQSNVTLIYVPSTNQTSPPTGRLLSPPKTKSSKKSSSTVSKTSRVHLRGSKMNEVPSSSTPDADHISPAQSRLVFDTANQIRSDRDKAAETGSQAITALKILSAKVGIEDQYQINRTDEQRRAIGSEHLSALEQLSRRVGDDSPPVPLETVLIEPAKNHTALDFPRLEQVRTLEESEVEVREPSSVSSSVGAANHSGSNKHSIDSANTDHAAHDSCEGKSES